MPLASRILFWLSLLGLAIPLTVPNFERAMSWTEAMPAVFAGLFFCSLFALFCVIFAPSRLKGDPVALAAWRRRAGITYGTVGLVFCLTVGTFVTVSCQKKIDDATSRSYRSSSAARSRYGSYGSYGTHDAYSSDLIYMRQDRYGRDLGIITAGTSILPIAFLIVALVATRRRALPPVMHPGAYAAGPSSWPPAYAGPPGSLPQPYAQPYGAGVPPNGHGPV
jgi:hypothetical protein